MPSRNKNQKGQGLLETIVATTIVVVGLTGIISLAGYNLIATNISSEQIVAVNLAREGIEVVRALRDSNWLDKTANWYDGFDDSSSDHTAIPVFDTATNSWTIDYGPDSLSNENTRIYIDANGVYSQSSGTATNFKRLLTINKICANNPDGFSSGNCGGGNSTIGYRVLSEVQWKEKENVRTMAVEERMFNWK